MSFPLPDNFKVPPISSYNEKEDPITHIEDFQTHPFFHNIPNETGCRVFHLTLKREANEWFDGLGDGFLDSFGTMKHRFFNQFSAMQKKRQHPASLFSLKQREAEPLGNFVKRFDQEMRTVDDLGDEIILSALINGMRAEEPLIADLARGSITGTLHQFISRIDGCVYQKEVIKALGKTNKPWSPLNEIWKEVESS